MATFTYPSSADIQQIAQDKLPRLMANRPIFDILPITTKDTSILIWEQRDNYTGLQQIRGMNGAPPNVKQIGAKAYQMRPGVYGEFSPIDELELTERRQWGSFGTPVSIADLVMEKQDQLLGRRLDRIEQIGWTLLTTGTFSVAGPNGAILQTDSYTFQTYTAAVAWATSATATPLADLSGVQLLSRGHSVNFGAVARMYMNRVTFNSLRTNTNNADIYGRRTQGLGTFNNLDALNTLFTGDDLPGITIYDEGYLNDSGTFVPFIPNNKVVVIGQRAGQSALGNYVMTRNANNPDLAPGAYMKVIDNGDEQVPRQIEIHDGHNGAPVLYWPSAIVVMTV